MSLEIAVPVPLFQRFKAEVLRAVFKADEPLLTKHLQKYPHIFEVCTFESDRPEDLWAVRAICAHNHARVLGV